MNAREIIRFITNVLHVFYFTASYIVMAYSGLITALMLSLIFADFLGVTTDITRLVELRNTIIFLPLYFVVGYIIQHNTGFGVNQAVKELKNSLKKKRK